MNTAKYLITSLVLAALGAGIFLALHQNPNPSLFRWFFWEPNLSVGAVVLLGFFFGLFSGALIASVFFFIQRRRK